MPDDESKTLIYNSRIKALAGDMRFSGDFWDALDKKVQTIVEDAVKRAKANDRATLRPADL